MNFSDAVDWVLTKMEGTKSKPKKKRNPKIPKDYADITKPCPYCKGDMIWYQLCWDLDKENHLVSFGWWRCTECRYQTGSRLDHGERKFIVPLEGKRRRNPFSL